MYYVRVFSLECVFVLSVCVCFNVALARAMPFTLCLPCLFAPRYSTTASPLLYVVFCEALVCRVCRGTKDRDWYIYINIYHDDTYKRSHIFHRLYTNHRHHRAYLVLRMQHVAYLFRVMFSEQGVKTPRMIRVPNTTPRDGQTANVCFVTLKF